MLIAKKTASAKAVSRLTACADIIRLTIKTGVEKLRWKTVKAVVDHIIQTLPQADGELFEPISHNYLRTLNAVLESKPIVERLSPELWLDIVSFCLLAMNSYLDGIDAEPSGLSRSFSELGTGIEFPSLVDAELRRIPTPSRSSSVSKQSADDLLLALLYLVSTTNPPLLDASGALLPVGKDIVSTLMRFLGTSTVGNRSAFSALNAVLSFCREDQSRLFQYLAQEAVVLVCRFWRGKSKDEMLNAVRDEMLVLLLSVHLHLERCVRHGGSPELSSNINDLLDVMKADYTRRNDRDRLNLADLDMVNAGTEGFSISPFQLHAFRLRPHNIKSERNWATLQVMGILERLAWFGHERKQTAPNEHQKGNTQPRKRQRTSRPFDRLLDSIRSEEESLRMAGLQLLPFVLQDYQLPGPVLAALLSQMSVCISDKRGHVSSWALLVIAR